MAGGKPSKITARLVALVAIIALAGIFLWCRADSAVAQGTPGTGGGGQGDRGGRAVTILAVNDIYRIDGVGAEELGGLHRLRTLRKDLDREVGKVLLLHAGDFLSPALEGRVFKGEQMIDAMNNLDGEPNKFDARMFVAFGNHEFDDSKCGSSPAPLPARIEESQFTWLVSNLDFSNCANMKNVPSLKNVKRMAIVDMNGIKIGIFSIGLTPDPNDSTKYPAFGDSYAVARAAIKELRAKKADVVIALTHLEREDDQLLIDALSGYGLDLVIGGHDHSWMELKDNAGIVRGYKADSDAKSAWRIKVSIAKDGKVSAEGKRILLDKSVPPDPVMAALAKKWSDQAEAKFCAERKKDDRKPNGDKCLQGVAGTAQFPIRLEEEDNRKTETEFGRWIARVVGEQTKADVALVHSGMLGLNTNLETGAELTLKQVVDIFRFDDSMAVREARVDVVCAAIRHGLGKSGTGAWPHIFGARPQGVPKTPKEAEASKRWEGEITFDNPDLDCKKDTVIKVAGAPYLLCGGDEYPLIAVNEPKAGCIEALRRKPMIDPGVAPPQPISAMAEKAIEEAGKVLKPAP
jgi:2',3'-cyclic-nucleotide 2'-phosphodiesterase (5'-nucleotidase family)